MTAIPGHPRAPLPGRSVSQTESRHAPSATGECDEPARRALGRRSRKTTNRRGLRDDVTKVPFAPNNPATRGSIGQLVKDALSEWEPRIDVLDINVSSPSDEGNTILIRIDYRVRSNNAFGNMVYPFYINEYSGG